MRWLKHLLWKDVLQDPQFEEVQVSCQEITIEQIDGALYAKLLAEATAAGAKFEGAQASISGLEFDWNYDEVAQALHVTCTKKPFYVGCDQVESRIRQLVEKSKGAL